VVALRRASRSETGPLWLLAALLIAAALGMSVYQVRTLPYANAVAIPVLGAWLAEIAARNGIVALRPLRPALPLLVPLLLAMPLVHLAVGWVGLKAAIFASGGRLAPIERPDAPKELVAKLTSDEKECIDPASAALFAQVPDGIVMAPVFYGPSALSISRHAVVAGPYHRAGPAILDTIHAMDRAPEKSLPIVRAHAVDYLAICTTSRESAITREEAPKGLLAHLLAGGSVPWLEPVPPGQPTKLKLWRVLR
jgi:hypothetical protein